MHIFMQCISMHFYGKFLQNTAGLSHIFRRKIVTDFRRIYFVVCPHNLLRPYYEPLVWFMIKKHVVDLVTFSCTHACTHLHTDINCTHRGRQKDRETGRYTHTLTIKICAHSLYTCTYGLSTPK